jgi:hypothetical protein
MSLAPTMFAKHRHGFVAKSNEITTAEELLVLDFFGYETTPFLSQILGLNLNQLMAPGLGIKSQLANGDKFSVFYFSETAYRFIIHRNSLGNVQTLIESHANDFDIELVARHDLAIARLTGLQAFDTLIDSFALTPGLRLSDEAICYGRQSKDVFVTALLEQGEQQYQLIAQQPTLQKWLSTLQKQGFSLN